MATKPPESPTALVPTRPAAGGIGALKATVHHVRRETGLLRGGRLLLRVNQEKGFDCPGCGWPEPERRSMFEFCENGAKAVAEEATRKRVTREVFAQHSLPHLRQMSEYELGRLGRLTEPMVCAPGHAHFVPITWKDAFQLLGEKLRALPSPDKAVFYTSGRTSNEAAFLYQLFVRAYGTNNLPDCSNLCHESSGVGMSEVLGVGKGTVDLEDFSKADLILVIGQNPGTNHPRMLSTLREAALRGCKIVSINPLWETGLQRFSHPQKPGDLLRGGVALTHLHVPVKIGADVPLLKGIMKEILAAEANRPGKVLDLGFVREQTTGFVEFSLALDAVGWDQIEQDSGVDRGVIRAVAELYMKSERVIACWAMGITQHQNAVGNVQEIVNLMLLRGNIGRPGAGLCPVRGHSNVQGDRTMGITSRPKPAFLDALGAEFGFQPPRKNGLDTVAAIQAMLRDEIGVYVSMGGNLYSAGPDTHATERALQSVPVTAHIATKLNRSHLYGKEHILLLPCLGRTEKDHQPTGAQFVTVEDSMSVVHRSQGALAPASDELLSEVAIVAGLARATLPDSKIHWSDFVRNYDRIRDHIARVIPGCENYNARVRQAHGFRLRNPAREREFHTPTGKARFSVQPLPDLKLPEGHLRLMTIRSHDQYNTTIYGLDDRYRDVVGERRVVFLNAQDMIELGIPADARVSLVSEYGGVVRRVENFLTRGFAIPRGCAAAYFPEANPLVPLDRFADKSRTPVSKSVVIRIER